METHQSVFLVTWFFLPSSNQKLIALYSENFFNKDNNPPGSNINDWFYDFYPPQKRLIEIEEEEKKNNHAPECVEEFLKKIVRIKGLGFRLWQFYLNNILGEDNDEPTRYRFPTKAEQMKTFESVLRSVDTDESKQTMAFHSFIIEEI